MIFGTTTPGGSWAELDDDKSTLHYFATVDLPEIAVVTASLIAYVDGNGSGSGAQVLRPVAFEGGSSGLATLGEEVTIADGQAAGWVHLPFDSPVVLRQGYEPRFGIMAGAAANAARIAYRTGTTVDNPILSTPYGVPFDVATTPDTTNAGREIACVLNAVELWAPPDVEDDVLAGLPFDAAQRALDSGGTIPPARTARVGWHHLPGVEPRGCYATARTGGEFERYVGERLRLTTTIAGVRRSAIVYVRDDQSFEAAIASDDLSVERRAFQRIAPLRADYVTAEAEVMA